MGQDEPTEQQLQAELDALRTANEPIHAKHRVASLRRAIADEMRAAKASELEARFTEEIGGAVDVEFRIVSIDDHMVVVKKPHELQYKKFRDRGKTDMVSCLDLVRPCLVYPTKEEFAGICESKPAMADAAAGAVLYLGGVRTDAKEGK